MLFNPIGWAVDIYGYFKSGTDHHGREMSSADVVDRGLKIALLFTPIKVGGAKTVVQQYSLRAAEDGFYPVMTRGFADAQELVWLNKGDVWKFGTTKNPLTRYSQSYLDNIGEFGVKYVPEFQGTLQQARTLQNMKILNFKNQSGFLPPGNKIIN